MADIQAKLQALSEEFTKLQQGIYFISGTARKLVTVTHARVRPSRYGPVEAKT
jgi:hypothetical protein